MILKQTQNCLYTTLITKKRKGINLYKYELHIACESMATYILNQFCLRKSHNLPPGGRKFGRGAGKFSDPRGLDIFFNPMVRGDPGLF